MGRHGNIQARPMPAPGPAMQTKPLRLPPGAAGPGGQDIGQALQNMRQQLQAPPGVPATMPLPVSPGGVPGQGGPSPYAPAGDQPPTMDQMAGLAPRYQEMAMKMGPQFAMQRAQDFAAGKLPGQQGQAPVMKPSLPVPMGPNSMGGGLNPAAGGGRQPGASGGSPPIFGGVAQAMGGMKPGGASAGGAGMSPDYGQVIDAMKGGRGAPATGGIAAQPGQGGPMMSKPLPFDPGGQGMQMDAGAAGQAMAPAGGAGGSDFQAAQGLLRNRIKQAMAR